MAIGTPAVPPGAPPVDLSGNRRRHFREKAIGRFFLAAGLSSLLISFAIVASLLGESITFLRNIDLGTLWSDGWFPRRNLYDIKTLFVGSLLVTGVGMIIATPLGLGSAIYLAEYARPRVRRLLKPIVEILAGIPSIVLGFFAFAWLSPEIVKRVFPDASGFNLAAAGIGVGILITPLVASVRGGCDARRPAIAPRGLLRHGRPEVHHSAQGGLPRRHLGIVAALILAISRAIGETMIVALAAGGSGGALFSTDIERPGQTITAAMASLASGTDQVAGGAGQGAGAAFNSLFFLGLLLFFVTLLLNVIGDLFVRRIRERY